MKNKIITSGISSLCEDGNHIILIDYDDISEIIVKNELKNIISKEKLGPFYLFKSSYKSYHARCVQKVKKHIATRIIMNTSADEGYKLLPQKSNHGTWVNRTEPKKIRNKVIKEAPSFLYVIESKYLNNRSSLAHLLYLHHKYGDSLPLIPYTNMDKSTQVIQHIYQTFKE